MNKNRKQLMTSGKSKKYRIARYILMLNSFLMLIYGIAVLIQPNLFTDNLEVYTAINLDELKNINEKLTDYIDMVIRLNGVLNMIIGAVGLIAVYKSFRIKEKWLLAIIFITNILGYLVPMTFDQITGVIKYPEIIEMVSFVFALLAFIIISRHYPKNCVSLKTQG